ncbi:hypothetical protein CBR_g8627 [Chara braunii]|uniref:Uncharacterized protein n=1 Tax=Chara braunii TaxID=69332 RepID=A0A388JS26_CHABU|nr:hypothetical protein CBR_g8627 [Chara braunii]|eukprot:GBG60606.1 hypothetical protein CBR_g8627 [Chara braunii]
MGNGMTGRQATMNRFRLLYLIQAIGIGSGIFLLERGRRQLWEHAPRLREIVLAEDERILAEYKWRSDNGGDFKKQSERYAVPTSLTVPLPSMIVVTAETHSVW